LRGTAADLRTREALHALHVVTRWLVEPRVLSRVVSENRGAAHGGNPRAGRAPRVEPRRGVVYAHRASSRRRVLFEKRVPEAHRRSCRDRHRAAAAGQSPSSLVGVLGYAEIVKVNVSLAWAISRGNVVIGKYLPVSNEPRDVNRSGGPDPAKKNRPAPVPVIVRHRVVRERRGGLRWVKQSVSLVLANGPWIWEMQTYLCLSWRRPSRTPRRLLFRRRSRRTYLIVKDKVSVLYGQTGRRDLELGKALTPRHEQRTAVHENSAALAHVADVRVAKIRGRASPGLRWVKQSVSLS
jgi:hypothetical protein